MGWQRIGAIDMEFLFCRLDFAGHGISRIDRFTGHWKRSDKPLVIGLALQVRGCGQFWSVYPVEDPEPHSRIGITDAIERSPLEVDGLLRAPGSRLRRRSRVAVGFQGAFSRLADNASRSERVVLHRFNLGQDSDLTPTGSRLRHQSSRWDRATTTQGADAKARRRRLHNVVALTITSTIASTGLVISIVS